MEYLYKYQSISKGNIMEYRSINNLLNNNALISSRKKFKDEYDSKFNLLKPSYDSINGLEKFIPQDMIRKYKDLINKDGFTKNGNEFFLSLEKKIEKMIDNNGIYCLTDNGTNKKMWNDYASYNKGFCIKFHKEAFGKEFEVYPMKYQTKIAQLKIYDMIRIFFSIGNEEKLAKEIHEKLFIKLDSYEWENEFRYIMSGNLKGKEFILKKYSREAVAEIIFGSEMKSEVKDYIVKHTNFKYTEIVKEENSLKIVDY